MKKQQEQIQLNCSLFSKNQVFTLIKRRHIQGHLEIYWKPTVIFHWPCFMVSLTHSMNDSPKRNMQVEQLYDRCQA